MAWYKHNRDGTLRTDAYKFTVKDLNDPEVRNLKQVIAAHNAEVRKACRRNKYGTGEYYANQLKRVRIMPRGARVEAAWGDYKSRRAYDSYLPIRHGETFDIYVDQDKTATYVMQRELQTGQTPGEQAKINRLQNEIWKITAEAHTRKAD